MKFLDEVVLLLC